MATLKDVAAAAGVSNTTVSLIINGKAKERRIAPATVERVYQTMNSLGYRPNMSARRLRSDESIRPTIAFYWPSDYRSQILGSFIMNFQSILQEINFDCEIVIRSYTNNELEKEADTLIKNNYNGAIIGAMSQEDVDYIEGIETTTPIVLLNRTSHRFSTVVSDSKKIGRIAAQMMLDKGYKEAAVFTSQRPYVATGARTQGFLYACFELGINVQASNVFRDNATLAGGANLAELYCNTPNPPKVIFCDSDFMALGALHTFHKNGIRLPKDVALISTQIMEEDFTKYATTPITTIALPNREFAKHALQIMKDQITNPTAEVRHETVEPTVIIRETFQI